MGVGVHVEGMCVYVEKGVGGEGCEEDRGIETALI